MEQVIPYLLLLLSIGLETARNVFSNDFSKRMLQNETDIYKFNFFMYIGSFLTLCCFGWHGCSLFTAITALLFALAIWLNQVFFLKALQVGPMSFTAFIQGAALVIPLIYGLFFWNETLSLWQIVWMLVLIGSMALALNLKQETLSRRWLLLSLGVMLFLGVIGVLQSTHQMSAHKEELVTFLQLAFLYTVVINLLGWRLKQPKTPATCPVKSSFLPMAAASGVCMGLVHVINLHLAGVLPKVVFFPVSNGGLIFITLLSDLIFFRERLDKKQWIGIIVGIVALSVIGL